MIYYNCQKLFSFRKSSLFLGLVWVSGLGEMYGLDIRNFLGGNVRVIFIFGVVLENLLGRLNQQSSCLLVQAPMTEIINPFINKV